jgi:hypothetical protein
MSSTPDADGTGFMILSNDDFERLSLGERVEYMKTAVAAVQRLQKQIQKIVEQVNTPPAS